MDKKTILSTENEMQCTPTIIDTVVATKPLRNHRLDLSRYPAWNSRKAEIRRWLIDQIADRAVELNEARKEAN